jgi:hypothetical protein
MKLIVGELYHFWIGMAIVDVKHLFDVAAPTRNGNFFSRGKAQAHKRRTGLDFIAAKIAGNIALCSELGFNFG